MQSKRIRISFLIFFGLLSILFLFILWPFLKAAFLALTLAIIFLPLYKFFLRKFGEHRYIASSVTTLIVAVCVIIPIGILVSVIVTKAGDFLSNFFSNLDERSAKTVLYPLLATVRDWIHSLTGSSPLANDIREAIMRIANMVADKLYQFSPRVLSTTVSFIWNFFLMFAFLLVFFAEGSRLHKSIHDILPIGKSHKEELIKNIRLAVTSSLVATFVTGIVQGSLLGLGFWIAGFDNPHGWWLIAILICIIPVIGAAATYITASLVLYTSGNIAGAIIFLFFGIAIVSTVDNVIRSFLIRGTSKIHPMLLFVTLIGGVKLFGPIGLIVGPVTLAIFLASLRIYRREYASNFSRE